ncbi:hypothetical protein OF83DRAFT_1176306 [Amylostereum chailletii]|nr:hypothetical protein OF83DRAFT_1176306 [Amylostereum chailletii]
MDGVQGSSNLDSCAMQPVPSHRRVPAELLDDIFKRATHVPGLMDVNPPHPSDMSLRDIRHNPLWDSGILSDSLRLRRSLTVVCRAWSGPAHRILHELIVIRGKIALLSLRDRSSLFPMRHLSPDKPNTFTRHVLLTGPRGGEPIVTGYRPVDGDELAVDNLASLLASLSNLQIFTVTKTFDIHLHDVFFRGLSRVCFSALLKFDLPRIGYIPDGDTSVVSKLFSRMSGLRTLTISGNMNHDEGWCPWSVAYPPQLQSLSLLSIRCRCDPPHNPILPAIEHMSFGHYHGWPLTSACPFQTSQGSQITSLHVDLDGTGCTMKDYLTEYGDPLFEYDEPLDGSLGQILRFHPNLLQLHLILGQALEIEPGIELTDLPLRLNHISIGIHHDLYNPSKMGSGTPEEWFQRCWEWFGSRLCAVFELLAEAIPTVSGLRVVRFLDPEILECKAAGLRLHRPVPTGVLNAQWPFRIEDRNGEALVPARVEDGVLYFKDDLE